MYELIDAETGAVLVGHVDVARRFSLGSARGLLGRSAIEPNAGLLLSDPLHCVHTLGMRFAIDVVFLDDALVVVDLAEDVGPRRLRWSRRGSHQLELAAGRASAIGVSRGMRVGLRVRRVDDGGQHPTRSPHVESRSCDAAHQSGDPRCGRLRDVPTLPPSAGTTGG